MASSQALALRAGEAQDHDSPGHEEAVSKKSQEDDYSSMVKIPAGKFKRGSTFQEIKGYLGLPIDKLFSLYSMMGFFIL